MEFINSMDKSIPGHYFTYILVFHKNESRCSDATDSDDWLPRTQSPRQEPESLSSLAITDDDARAAAATVPRQRRAAAAAGARARAAAAPRAQRRLPKFVTSDGHWHWH